jgi:predicted acylesterase/phospholipase RssA
MSQKLAIAISGAVSLGSFESGVMYEIIEAIAQHNQHQETTEDQKIIIDVITGASAGAMTAAILAQKLLFEADRLRGPYQNDIYRAWVEDADIRTLLQSGGDDNPDMAILSSGFVKQVGNKYLLSRYSSPSLPSAQRHPAVADKIHLGIALSNLNGFDYTINLANIQGRLNSEENQENSFTFTRHKDCYISQIQGNQQDDKRNLWDLIKRIAIASGAFPFAFKVQEIERQTADPVYKDSVIYESGVIPFAYTDGGIFENEPLGMAISLTKKLDKPRDYENRFFLYVAPGPKSSEVNKDFTASQAVYVNTARALAGAIFTQARFQDWINVSETNQSVKEFDSQAWFLKDLLKEYPEKYSEFELVAEKLLQTLYADNELSQQQRHADNKRLKEQFKKEYQELASLGGNGEEIAISWLKAVQALEKAANLGSKELLVIYAITAKDGELAGERLSAFGGFFDKEFRNHDYYVGRTKAIDFLKELQGKNSQGKKERQLYLLNFEPGKNLQKPAVDLGDVDLDKVDRKLREQVKNLLLERLGRILDSIERRPLVAWPFKFFAKMMADDKLDKLLKLR